MSEVQMSLPYEEIKSVASRKVIREKFRVSGNVAYWIAFKDISIREGFNKREDYSGIEELAESIFEHGLNEPFRLDITSDDKNYIQRGHRRHRAYLLLIEQGKFDAETEVQFFPSSSEETERSRLIDQVISNNFRKEFNPLELAKVAFELKHNFSDKPLTHEEVAKDLKYSRQTVDNLIHLHEAPDDLKNQIRLEKMSYTKATDFLRSQRKFEKQLDKVEEAAANSSMFVQPEPKDLLKGELEELKEAEDEADRQRLEREANEIVPESETPEQKELRLQIKAEKDYEKLLEVSDEVKATKKNLKNHIGKKLSADITYDWEEEVENEMVPRKTVIEYKGRELTEEIANQIVENKVPYVFVYKQGMEPVAASVITEPIATKEKDKYDLTRPEIAQVQNCIGLLDKLEAITNRFDIPEGSKKDVADIIKWVQYDLSELRTWIHSNKKQNKIR